MMYMDMLIHYSMAPLQSNCDTEYSAHVKVKTTKHPVGEWPLYVYHFDPISVEEKNSNHEETTGTNEMKEVQESVIAEYIPASSESQSEVQLQLESQSTIAIPPIHVFQSTGGVL